MDLFAKRRQKHNINSATDPGIGLIAAERPKETPLFSPPPPPAEDRASYDRIRTAVPIVDAAIMKIIRLTGGFKLISSDPRCQKRLDAFLESVPVGITGNSIGFFADSFLDSLLTYGSAVAEIVIDTKARAISGLYIGDVTKLELIPGKSPLDRNYAVHSPDGKLTPVTHPERILYACLPGGKSILRGLAPLCGILTRIYECVGQNFDRAGNVRYAVTYRPSPDGTDIACAHDRAARIAREWSDGINSARYGRVKDFIAVGDVDIKVIGADGCMPDTEVPVRQLLEQILSKLSVPPFLLGLSWSTTERMSAQQADILTSELEYYRRVLTPVLTYIGDAYLCLLGSDATCTAEWDNINLQDEEALADARLKNAEAAETELRTERERNRTEETE